MTMEIWNLHTQGQGLVPLLTHEGRELNVLIIKHLIPDENCGGNEKGYMVKNIPYRWNNKSGVYMDVLKNALLVREAAEIDIGASVTASADAETANINTDAKTINTDKLTIEDIKESVENIRQLAEKRAHESAHYNEDVLYQKFVAHVAANTTDPELAEMAKEVLKTRDIDFCHWYA